MNLKSELLFIIVTRGCMYHIRHRQVWLHGIMSFYQYQRVVSCLVSKSTLQNSYLIQC